MGGFTPGWIRTTDPRIRKIGVVGIITLSDWVHTRYCPYVALTYPSQLGVGSPAGTWLGLVTPPPRPLRGWSDMHPPLGKARVVLGLGFRCEVAFGGGVGEGDEYIEQVVAVT